MVFAHIGTYIGSSWRRSQWLCYGICCLLLWPGSTLAGLRPIDGGGSFHTVVDVVNRWVQEDRLDVMVLVAVRNADLRFRREGAGWVARLAIEVRLESLAGETITRTRHVHSAGISPDDAASEMQSQVFGVLLQDVPFRAGRLDCQVVDLNHKKPGLLNNTRKQGAMSTSATAWAAPETPRPQSGVALEEPLYLLQAPFEAWQPSLDTEQTENSGWLHDYVHPSRRYGLEQDHLQIFQPVWPQIGGVIDEATLAGLRVEVSSLDLNFVLTDTVVFDARGRIALAAGRPAALFYSLDINLLPEGAYRLSMAPLDGRGRGSLTRFDVVWRLGELARSRNLVLGEGRTVFTGKGLRVFLAESPAQQHKLLKEFWADHNPDPENYFNAAYVEFQQRVAYVQSFLGGFGEFGAVDDRGAIYLVLGEPDEVQRESMPMNFRDQDDARIKVYQRFAPDRDSVAAKGSAIGGTQTINPYKVEGGIPMPFSRSAERDRQKIIFSASHNFPFELWKYDSGGNLLFDTALTRKGLGQRFLFVDATGTGEYVLESSNLLQPDE